MDKAITCPAFIIAEDAVTSTATGARPISLLCGSKGTKSAGLIYDGLRRWLLCRAGLALAMPGGTAMPSLPLWPVRSVSNELVHHKPKRASHSSLSYLIFPRINLRLMTNSCFVVWEDEGSWPCLQEVAFSGGSSASLPSTPPNFIRHPLVHPWLALACPLSERKSRLGGQAIPWLSGNREAPTWTPFVSDIIKMTFHTGSTISCSQQCVDHN